MATRNPVSVLPVPVGEATSTSRPSVTSGHADRWGSVGPSGKRPSNQARTAGWNESRTAEVTGPAGSVGRLSLMCAVLSRTAAA